jgi:diguanylate cyclase (GGDEF)-like protein
LRFKIDEAVSAKSMLFALAGGVLGLGAPAGLLLMRSRRSGLSWQSAIQEIQADRETYVYTATSTTVAFALFGGVLGHYADRLARLATTDPLTGLFNTSVFHDRLGYELRRAARYREPLSLLIMDLDGLKRVNDQSGHLAGDAALRSVAAAIRCGLREIDLGARIGGDEFAVLAPRTNEAAAVVLAERLRSHVAKGIDARVRRGITISIGIASVPAAAEAQRTPVSLIAAADEALYVAKRGGGNRVSVSRSSG